MDPQLDLRTARGATTLHIRGDLDIAAEDATVEAVVQAFAADGAPDVLVVDLSEVEFIDSSGLRALLRIHKRYGDRVKVGPVSASVERLLELTGTAEVLGAEEGREEA